MSWLLWQEDIGFWETKAHSLLRNSRNGKSMGNCIAKSDASWLFSLCRPIEGGVTGEVAIADASGGDIIRSQDRGCLGRENDLGDVNLVVGYCRIGEIALQATTHLKSVFVRLTKEGHHE